MLYHYLSLPKLMAFTLLLSILLSACAPVKPEPSPEPILTKPINQNNMGWRTVCFQLVWARKQEPDWAIGTQLAGEIIAPALASLRPHIKFWRFHRRAKDDVTGHTFSFMVYSSSQTAEHLYTLIKTHPTTVQLQKTRDITDVRYDPPDKNPKPELKDTSDPDWPIAIQKTWPVFIMGVSQMWLDLVLLLKSEQPDQSDQRKAYQAIHEQVNKLWEKHGQHAWLHHLNALYGYSPLAIHF